MDLVFGKWIYPSIFVPTLPPFEFGQKLGNHHRIRAVLLLLEDSVHTGHRDPVHTGPRAHGPHLPRAHGLSMEFRPSFVLHHFASIPTLVFFHTISRGCLSFGPRFLLCPKVFRLLRRIWTSSSPPLDHQLVHHTGFNNFFLTVRSDGNLDDISFCFCIDNPSHFASLTHRD